MTQPYALSNVASKRVMRLAFSFGFYRQTPDTGSWILDLGSWILDLESNLKSNTLIHRVQENSCSSAGDESDYDVTNSQFNLFKVGSQFGFDNHIL